MALKLRFAMAAPLALAPWVLAACVEFDPDTTPQTIERRGAQTADNTCELGDYKVYRPIPREKKGLGGSPSKAPYDAVIPPTYDVPSRLPSYCADKLGK